MLTIESLKKALKNKCISSKIIELKNTNDLISVLSAKFEVMYDMAAVEVSNGECNSIEEVLNIEDQSMFEKYGEKLFNRMNEIVCENGFVELGQQGKCPVLVEKQKKIKIVEELCALFGTHLDESISKIPSSMTIFAQFSALVDKMANDIVKK